MAKKRIVKPLGPDAAERDIKAAIRLALGREPDLVLWNNPVGVAIPINGCRPVHYGLCDGSSDLIGILSPGGRIFCLETKTRRGRMSSLQRMFMELVRSKGGFADFSRTVVDAWDCLEAARQGMCAKQVEKRSKS